MTNAPCADLSPPKKRARTLTVRFAQHRERHFAPCEAANAVDAEEARSVPTTPTVEARRDAAIALRAQLFACEEATPTLATAALDQLRRIVDAKLETLQGLLERQAQPPEADDDDAFFARVPRFTRLPGLWGARDLMPVTLQSLAVLRQLQATLRPEDGPWFSSAWAEGAPPEKHRAAAAVAGLA